MEEVSSWYVKERDPYYIIGRDEGVTLERTRSKLSIARKMKKEGLTIPLIAKITDLSREEILNIKL